ncbi:hypothetical protein RUM43_014991 [Polyplax serrata]|uniref:Uncharacterized protein n=1 Tax=Polyplax serrata TaxID=468196 RepID=A0AAN8NP75_POLSC
MAGSYISGICFMGLYYRLFHVRRLTYWSNEGDKNCESPDNNSSTRWTGMSVQSPENAKPLNDYKKLLEKKFSVNYHEKIPGVFNCRFSSPYGNTAAERKKKKPTTFVPPPSVTTLPTGNNSNPNFSNTRYKQSGNKLFDSFHDNYTLDGYREVPFWKRPLPSSIQHNRASSENEGSIAGPRIDIQHKLQEKKQKQLEELQVIEEEIKQGKIQRTVLNIANVPETSLQPIPSTKRHIDSFMLNSPKPLCTSLRGFTYQLLPPTIKWPHARAHTPEILLAPHLLDSNGWGNFRNANYPMSCEGGGSGQESNSNETPISIRKYCRSPSDVDSLVSLPRSYTLPREYKHWKTNKSERVRGQLTRSTNSSDGDVDSADESVTQNSPVARRKLRQIQHRHVMHETKL